MLALLGGSRELSQELATRESARAPWLAPADRELLMRWTRATTTPQRVLVRSAVILLAAAGLNDARIARELGVTRRTVALWRQRFRAGGPQSLLSDAPGRGRKKGRDREAVERILVATRDGAPGLTGQWTVRSLARHVGVSHATVQRVWKEHGVAPSRPQPRDPNSGDGNA